MKQLCMEINVGDVVAFKSRGVFSFFIRLVQRVWNGRAGVYTHVGVVCGTKEGKWVLDESTTKVELKDLVSGERRSGAQRHLLEERLASANVDVDLFPLKRAMMQREKVLFRAWLQETISHGYDWKQVAWAGLDLSDKVGLANRLSEQRLFCSERVCFAFMKAGLLSKGFNPSEATPADVVSLEILGSAKALWRV